MSRIIGTAGLVMALFSTLIPILSTAAVDGPLSAPHQPAPGILRHLKEQDYSLNWSGYAVPAATNGAVTDVQGSWTVPGVTGTSTSYSSIWVGIDGFSSSTVEQIGTEQDVVVTRTRHGTITTTKYSAWYEMYPNYPVTIPRNVYQGDVMSAEVNWTGGNSFALTLNDTTAGHQWSYSTTQTLSTTAQRNSAEWVVEAPSSVFGVLPLANFGTANLTNGTATIGGASRSIDSFGNNQEIIMVSSRGTLRALPSSPPNGGSFNVTWYHQ